MAIRLADRWIWARLKQTVNSVNSLFDSHQYGEAGRQIYDFFWNEFADWYIEASKKQLSAGGGRAYYTTYLLARVTDIMLRLLHPFTPFVTEALWGYLKEACQASGLNLHGEAGWEDAVEAILRERLSALPAELVDPAWSKDRPGSKLTLLLPLEVPSPVAKERSLRTKIRCDDPRLASILDGWLGDVQSLGSLGEVDVIDTSFSSRSERIPLSL